MSLTPHSTSTLQPDLATLMVHLSEVCLVVDEAGKCLWASDNCERLLGRSASELCGVPLPHLIHRDDAAALLSPDDGATVQVRLEHPCRPHTWVELRRVPTSLGTLCLLRDATALRTAQQTVARATQEDLLTGLAHRAHILQTLRTELARAHRYERPLAIVLVDIDGLRLVNQSHGTSGGDLVLELAARTLDGCVRGMDYLGRTDADEFLILLPETDREGAVLLAERVRAAMEGLAVRLPRGMVRPTVTAGVAFVSSDDDAEGLRQRASMAVLQGKLAGGNRVSVAHTPSA